MTCRYDCVFGLLVCIHLALAELARPISLWLRVREDVFFCVLQHLISRHLERRIKAIHRYAVCKLMKFIGI